jgi:hypothetical protein
MAQVDAEFCQTQPDSGFDGSNGQAKLARGLAVAEPSEEYCSYNFSLFGTEILKRQLDQSARFGEGTVTLRIPTCTGVGRRVHVDWQFRASLPAGVVDSATASNGQHPSKRSPAGPIKLLSLLPDLQIDIRG